MLLTDIPGQEEVRAYLAGGVLAGRIPHAQLLIGPEGCGTLPVAIAYAQAILCAPENTEVCQMKFQNLSHPDLHFIYPTVKTYEIKSKPKSADFIQQWREFVLANPYGSLFDWYDVLGVQNKQGEIRTEDAQEILKTLSLKAYEGGYKVVIIWMAEKMNIPASNKLLKLLEEPSEKTVFLLIAEDEEEILPTIRSRCQVIHLARLSNSVIAGQLIASRQIDERLANRIAHQANGNYNKALQMVGDDNADLLFEKYFVEWVRGAFRAKGNAAAIQELISWSEHIASMGRETQKRFLHFCIDMFRQTLMLNYQATELVYMEPTTGNFRLENFAPFVNGGNIGDIFTAISDAIYHIERNGNAKIILADLSIRLTRLIHKK